MKSQKAKEFIEKGSTITINGHKIGLSEAAFAFQAVELAEAELFENAVEAHKKLCKNFIDNDFRKAECYIKPIEKGKWEKCNVSCVYMQEFINQLNK